MMDHSELLDDLLSTFTEELADIVESIEQALLRFENDLDNSAVLGELFRYYHNLKGSSKTIGLEHLSGFAHNVEHTLSSLRTGDLKPFPELIDKLLVSSDILRAYYDNLSSGFKDEPADMVRDLQAFTDELKTISQKQGECDPSRAIEEEDLAEEPVDFNEVAIEENNLQESSLPIEAINSPASSTTSSGFNLFEQNELDDPIHDKTGEPLEKSPDFCEEEEQSKEAAEKITKLPSANTQPQSEPHKREPSQRIENIKIPLNRIDELLELFGEQVILQSSLDHILEGNLEEQRDFIQQTISSLKKITQDLRYTMVNLRMVPITPLFSRLERSVRDTARITGKSINFLKNGQSCELDKSIVDALVDPLTHMVRNAVDHGIEEADTRKAAGKDTTGKVVLSAGRNGGSFEIVLSDDGKGLDRDAIIAKAQKLGLLHKNPADLSDAEAFNFIFHSGFSTRQQASEISGRGVGMDVVNEKLKQLKGSCHISSRRNYGTTFTIRLPQSLAMFNGTIILVNDERYVVANSDFHETLALDHSTLSKADLKHNKLRLGERILNLIDLRKTLAVKSRNRKNIANLYENQNLAIITKFEDQEFAFLVSDIISQEQIVLKQLSQEVTQIKESCGGTILGDGKVALVLDLSKVISNNYFKPKMRLAS